MNVEPLMRRPPVVETALLDLIYVSQVGVEQLLYLDGRRGYHDATSWWDYFIRLTSPDHRKRTLNFISDLLDRVIDIINNPRHSVYQEEILTAMTKARGGIINLAETYRKHKRDGDVAGKLDAIAGNFERTIGAWSVCSESFCDKSLASPSKSIPIAVPNSVNYNYNSISSCSSSPDSVGRSPPVRFSPK